MAQETELFFCERLDHEKSLLIDWLRIEIRALNAEIDRLKGIAMADENSGSGVEEAVERVLDHLKHQRVGEPAARDLKNAAERSIDQHQRNNNLGRAISAGRS
jgi:hypothetical protein